MKSFQTFLHCNVFAYMTFPEIPSRNLYSVEFVSTRSIYKYIYDIYTFSAYPHRLGLQVRVVSGIFYHVYDIHVCFRVYHK